MLGHWPTINPKTQLTSTPLPTSHPHISPITLHPSHHPVLVRTMPVVRENYPCRNCEKKTHTLYFAGNAAPELHRQHFHVCPSGGFATRVTVGDGWFPVDSRPKGAIEVHCGDGAGRAEDWTDRLSQQPQQIMPQV